MKRPVSLLIPSSRFVAKVRKALPGACVVVTHGFVCVIRAAFSLLLVVLIPAPLNAASLVGLVRAHAGGAAGDNPAGGTGGQSVDSATASLLAQIQAQSLSKTNQTILAAQAAQQAARAAALASAGGVANGLVQGGLVPASGVPSIINSAQGVTTYNIPASWQGVAAASAGGLTEKISANGQTTVDIKQTASTAILTWDEFDIGTKTALDFDQQNSGCVVINNLTDASASPSKILGQINALGSVYIVNRNGIVFGGASQVNVATLVASALPINTSLLNAGTFFSNPDDCFNFTAYDDPGGSIGPTAPFTPPAATTTSQNSSVIVQQGAQISTPTNAEHDGGHVILVGPEVENAGNISTPDGQTILAAGQQVALVPHSSSDASIRGFDVYVGSIMAPVVGVASPSISTAANSVMTGQAANTGIITADRGNITMSGAVVNQDGILDSTTSVSLNGSIRLQAQYNAYLVLNGGVFIYPGSTGSVAFGENSVLQILPEDTTEEITGSLAYQSLLNVIGLTVYLGPNSSIVAPDGEVTIQAGKWIENGNSSVFSQDSGQIYCDTGATIDVSGAEVQSSVSQNIVAAQLEDAQLADSPLQRDSFLHGSTVYVDSTLTGELDGVSWTGTPLADVTGYINLIEHTVGELTTNGGTVNMDAGSSIVMRQGSSINVSNGWVDYLGGVVPTTRLIGADGNIYDISQASPNMVYTGFAGSYSIDHAKWGITDTYTSPLIPTEVYDSGYIQGGSGGQISLEAPAMLLYGNLYGSTVAGERQRTASSQPMASSFSLYFEGSTASSVALLTPETTQEVDFNSGAWLENGSQFNSASNNFSSSNLSVNPATALYLPASLVGKQGFGVVSITDNNGNINVDSALYGTLGGSLSLTGENITLGASITLPSAGLAPSPVLISNGGVIPNGLTCSTVDIDPNVALSLAGGSAPVADAAGRGTLTVESGVTLNAAGLQTDAFGDGNATNTPLIVNGGSISLTGLNLDLKQGSVVEVSGGVTINPDGSLQKGNGGGITLSGGMDTTVALAAPRTATLDATLLGYGFTAGGSLSVAAPLIQIGGVTADPDILLLSPSFFNQGGFSSFTLTGIGQGTGGSGQISAISIAPDTDGLPTEIAPAVESYALTVGKAGSLGVTPELLAAGMRPSVSLVFNANGFLNPSGSVLARGDFVLGTGASIYLAPTEEGQNSVSVGGGESTASIFGDIIAPCGSISINGSYIDQGNLNTAETNVVLAPGSVISAAGATLLVPDAYGRKIGSVLNGGSISVSGNVLAEPGSMLNVSGCVGSVDMPADSNILVSKDELTQIDSNGGTITFNGKQDLYIAGTLLGGAGGPSGVGGTLTVSSGQTLPSASALSNLIVTQDLPQFTYPLDSTGKANQQVSNAIDQPILDSSQSPMALGYFSADRFLGTGFASLVLGGNVQFSGPDPVDILAKESITVATGNLLTANCPVNLSAPYVAIGSPYAAPLLNPSTSLPYVGAVTTQWFYEGTLYTDVVTPSSGAGSLNISAGTLIDVGYLALQGIGEANLSVPNGDIRGYGTLAVQGAITLTAGQIYPTTDAEFTIAALDTPSGPSGSVKIGGGSARPLPLSACGVINIFATDIIQDGVLRAPFGQINLGSTTQQQASYYLGSTNLGTMNFDTTASLTLSAGSVTSVSGAGLVVPYGTEVNGSEWIDPLGNNITAGGLPAKVVNIAAASVDIGQGATIDLRGGGELVAYNWVEGIGGENDILNSTSSFAVVPGYGLGYAPLASVTTVSSNGNTTTQTGWSDNLAVGEQIWLNASEGLPAGYYTLLPARYALLPGAYLVTQEGSGLEAATYSEPVGTNIVSGYENNGFTPTQPQTTMLGIFEVNSNALVHTFAEYDVYSGDATLRSGALNAGDAVPRLPIDAGQLVLFAAPTSTVATASMTIQGRVLSAAPAGGLGAMVDIGSPSDIVINDSGTGPSGKLYLSAGDLSQFGAESLLIGGIRTTTSAGTLVNVTTGNIEDSSVSDILSGPEIILVANNSITLDPGADIEQVGTLSSPAQLLQIGNSTTSGNGALLRVSSDDTAQITRTNITPGTSGAITIDAGATVSGNAVILDSTADTSLDPSATLSAGALTLGSGRISLELDNPGTLPQSAGLILSTSDLTDFQNNLRSSNGSLILQSYSSIDLYGTGSIGTVSADGKYSIANLTLNSGGICGFNTDGGTVTFNVQNITIENASNIAAPVAGADDASSVLAFNSEKVTLADPFLNSTSTFQLFQTDAFGITNYGTVNIGASTGVLLTGNGSVSTTGAMSFTTSLVAVGANANVGFSAQDTLTVDPASGNSNVVAGLGGKLELDGAGINMNGFIEAPSGQVTLHATGQPSGSSDTNTSDVDVAGVIDASGKSDQFFDQTSYTNGGAITLESDLGSVNIAQSGVVNVSAQDGGGNAGTLNVSAINGSFTIATGGKLLGYAKNGIGGSFVADLGGTPGGATDLGAINTALNYNATLETGGFTDSRSFRVRAGDVTVNDAGETDTAKTFTVSADGGSITVNGEIDASGQTGGQITLCGYNGVTLANGSELNVSATEFDAAGKGGSVDLETGQAELIDGVMTPGVGWIDIASGSKIDLSVNNGTGGTLYLYSPQITAVDANGNPIVTDVSAVNNWNGGEYVAIKPIEGSIIKPSSVVVVGVQTYDLTTDPNNPNGAFSTGGVITSTVETDLNKNGINFAGYGAASPGNIPAYLLNNTPNAGLASLFHVQPGEDLVSRSVNVITLNTDGNGDGSASLPAGAQATVSYAQGASATDTVTCTSAGTYTYIDPATGQTEVEHFSANSPFTIYDENGSGGTVALNSAGTMNVTSGGAAITASVDSLSNSTLNGTGSVTVPLSGQAMMLTSNGSSLQLPAGTQITFVAAPSASDWITLPAGTLTIPSGDTAQEEISTGGALNLTSLTLLALNGDTLTGSGFTMQVMSGGSGINQVMLLNGNTIKPISSSIQSIATGAGFYNSTTNTITGDSISVSAGSTSNTSFQASVSGEIVNTSNGTVTSFSANTPVLYSSYAGDKIILNSKGTITYSVGSTVGTITFQSSTGDTAVDTLPSTGTYFGSYTVTGAVTSLGTETNLKGTFAVSAPAGESLAPIGEPLSAGNHTFSTAGTVLSELPAGTTFTETSSNPGTLTASNGSDSLSLKLTGESANYTVGYTTSAAGSLVVTPNANLALNSDWNFYLDRYGSNTNSSGAGEPGVLTLCAEGNIVLHGSLSDGFMPASSTLPSPYNVLASYSTELWEEVLLPAGSQSWSYRLTAGADLSGANFQDMEALEDLPAGEGSVMLGLPTPGATSSSSATTASALMVNGVSYYQVIRTGVGNIDISAGRDVQVLNQFATIYTAGMQVAVNTQYFNLPNVTLGVGESQFEPYYLPQYSTGGGNVTITAQEDIEHLTQNAAGQWVDDSEQQLPVDWLYRRAETANGVFVATANGDIASTTWWIDFSNFFEGVGALGGGNVTLSAGRDVVNVDAVIPTNAWMPYATVTSSGAVDYSVADLALDHLLVENGGGSLIVSAGRNINGGVYYVEGRQPDAQALDPQAQATGLLTAGGEITTNETRSESATINSSGVETFSSDPLTWLPTTLFAGDASFTVSAHDSIELDEALNVFLLPPGLGNSDLLRSYFQTYGADSTVSVESLTGNVTLEGETDAPANPTTLSAWFYNVLAAGPSTYRPWLHLTEPQNPYCVLVSVTARTEPLYTLYATALQLSPGTLSVAAFSGDIDLVGSITLSPSPSGNLNLLAAGSIDGFQKISSANTTVSGGSKSYSLPGIYESASINLSDANPDAMPTPYSPLPIDYLTLPSGERSLIYYSSLMTALDVLFDETGASQGVGTSTTAEENRHDSQSLHANDPTGPVRVYAQADDITGLQLFTPKETQIIAGGNIEDIAFYLQNLNKSDVSEVIAGNDIIAYDEATPPELLALDMIERNEGQGPWNSLPGDIEIGGPGTLEVLAGRNLNLGGAPTSAYLSGAFSTEGVGLGIVSVGDSRNPYLPMNDGAAIIAASGFGKGTGEGLAGSNVDFSAFVSDFLNPTTGGAEAQRYLPELASLMGLGGASDQEIWDKFYALSDNGKITEQQGTLALDIFYLVLRDAGRDYNDPTSPNYHSYKAGFEAISALFPDNAWNGDMSLNFREIKTTSGGDINLLAPGGQIVVGYQTGNTQALDQGIMTTDGGNINIFSNGDVSVGVSRIFIFKGGNEIIWSTTGNIDAGNGSKTEQAAPPAQFLINPVNGMETIDLSGLATGAGIGVLETMPGVPSGDVDLIAPVGIVNAGDAGIRVSGNLNIAAAVVLNAANIQVQGNSTGVPVVAAPNIGAMSLANNTSGAATSAAQAASQSQNSSATQTPPSIFEVQVLGYGLVGDEPPEEDNHLSRHAKQAPESNVEVHSSGTAH